MCAARKDREKLFRKLRRLGWHVEKRKRGHVRLKSPDGPVYFTGSTPGDVRANVKLLKDLRKIGPVPG